MEFLGKNFVSCKEIVPISEVKETSPHGRDVVLSQRVPYQRLHGKIIYTLSTVYRLNCKLTNECMYILASKYAFISKYTFNFPMGIY